MKKHWLIAYVYRATGSASWIPANLAWQGSVGAALKYLNRLDEEQNCTQVILSAMPISAAEYKWAKENI